MKKDEIPYLRCYKMTYDTGFAPNPYHGVLTLATCKPVIRRCAKVGDWIAGWTANRVFDKDENPICFNGEEQKLIYLARITKIISLVEYWNAYPQKRPNIIESGNETSKRGCGGSHEPKVKSDHGDNIYRMGKNGKLEQVYTYDHKDTEYERDTSGKNALICEEFYYFGVNNAVEIKKEIFDYIVPRYKKIDLNDCQKFIEYVRGLKNVTISSKHP
jgi:hypothetical protein